jgi:hypothetical protein
MLANRLHDNFFPKSLGSLDCLSAQVITTAFVPYLRATFCEFGVRGSGPFAPTFRRVIWLADLALCGFC